MAKYIVEKSEPLKGNIKVSGAKNAVLPIMAAAIMATGPCYLEEIPKLSDIEVMSDVLRSLGSEVLIKDNELEIITEKIENSEAPYELVQKMRASFFVMGPLLARTGRASIPMPGGCAIGARPVDLHLKGFAALGATIKNDHGSVEAVCDGKLQGATIYLDFPSVGATENIMMAATLAEGQTIIQNAAEEPEISDLANFLNKMGANIKGAGTDTIRITGVESLGGARHTIIPDRIEAGTYMAAAAITKGELRIENVIPGHLKPMIAKLREAGVTVDEGDDFLVVKGTDDVKSVDVTTLPYPGFPTDMQAQFMTFMALSKGHSVITETVFENRFMHVIELSRMGADIRTEGHSAVIHGVETLQGAQVQATDLRAGAALILAGLVADGVTEVGNIYHIDRGYTDLEQKLRAVGAKIKRVE